MQVTEGEAAVFDDADLRYLRRALGGLLEQRPTGWAITRVVGRVPLPSGRSLRIRSPKATTTSILAWAAYADPTLRALRELAVLELAGEEDGLDLHLARVYVAALTAATRTAGIVRAYTRTPQLTTSVRGSIDFARLVHRGGDVAALPCIVWERLHDTPLNRLLAVALDRLWASPEARRACNRELPALRAVFQDVRRIVDPDLLAGRRPLSRLESALEVPCALARLIVRSTGLAEQGAEHGLAFLVNLEDLFERAVARAFRDANIGSVSKEGLAYEQRRGSASTRRAFEMDVFVPRTAAGPLVVDAKFKSAVSSENLQQMVTYCHLTGARRAVLVFPEGRLTDKSSFVFPTPGDGARTVRVDTAELRTDACDLAGWRRHGAEMVAAVLGSA